MLHPHFEKGSKLPTRNSEEPGSLAELKHAYPSIQILSDVKEIPYINGEKERIKAKKLREMYDNLHESQQEMVQVMQRKQL